ncbi:MAG: class I SAM-dependent methyltransferase [Nitrososphaerales archaeon]|nr:class I SAM-dependent methyltransferase [Nitrososphaerales archaeon]
MGREISTIMKLNLALPKKSLDLIYMRNVTHYLPDRAKYFRNLADFLKPKDKIAIIEYKKGGRFSFHRMVGHYVPTETLMKEMEEAGYTLEKDFDFLPEQSFTIFSLKNVENKKNC